MDAIRGANISMGVDPLGGLKVIAASGWFAARPARTEDIYRIYVESFRGEQHLRRIADEAQAIVDTALAAGAPAGDDGRKADEQRVAQPGGCKRDWT